MASWLSAVSVIALVASGVMVSQPATAASGGSGVSSGTIFGGAAGADGTAADATGKDGFSGGPATSGGGGGAVDLTTGQGAHGGSQWNISYKNKGVPGADGAAGANTDLVNRNIVGAGGILGASGDSVTSTSGSGGGGGGGGVSTDQFITVTGSGSVVGGAGGNGGTSSGGGGGGVGIFTSAGGNVDSGGAVTGGKGGDALGYGGGGGGAAAILMTGGGILTNSGTIIGGAGGGTDTRTPALGGVGGNGGEGILLTNGGTVVNKADATITGGNSGKNGTNLAKFGAQASKGGNGISGANVSIVNAGTISGGATTGGGVVDAIRFTGGVNSLEIWSTSVINGNVQAYSSADKFTLGGGENSTFDVSTIGDTAKYRGFGGFGKTGTSSWTLTGTNTGVTPWTLSGGTLSISQDESLGDEAGDLTFNGGTLQTTDSFEINRAITLTVAGGAIETATGTVLTVTSAIDGAGGLTKLSAGTLVLTGNNSYAGGTTISAGTLQLGNGGTTGSTTGDVLNNGTLAVNRSDTLTLAGTISGTGSLDQFGTGTTILTGNNNYTGGTTISAGTLQLGNGGTTGSITGDVLNNGTLAVDRSDTLTLAGKISGTGLLNQSGTGTTILTGNNSYTGGTTISAGTLQLGNGGTTGSITGDVLNNGTLAVNRSDTLTLAGKISGTGLLNQSGTGTTILTGNNSYTGGTTISAGTLQIGNGGTTGSTTGNVLNNGTLAVNRSDTLTLAGKISGTGLLNQSGTGTTILSGNNSYAGGTTISAGTLQLGNGGTTGSITGNVLNNGTLAVDRSDTLTLAGAISGTGSFNQIGTGTTILTGNNSYTGGTTISGGTLQIGNGSTTGSITGNVLNNGALVFKRSDLAEFGGVISGTGTLLQSGTGTLVLTGANSYSGQTTIEAGTLMAGGDNVFSSGSAHSVLDGAKLDLDGHNQTIVSLNNAGAVYLSGKGNTAGTALTIAGDYVGKNGTIIFNTELAGDTSKTDRLVVNGDTSGSTSVQVRNLNGTGALTVDGIKIIEIGGASDGAFSLQGDYVFEGQQAVVGGAYAYRLYQNGVSSPTDGDWYLRSELKDKTPLYQAGVSVYEAYAGALLNLNSVSTLQQRVGTRYANNGAATQSAPSEAKAPAVWGRIEAAHSKFAPNTSTSSTDYDLDTFKMQAGLDGQFYESTTGKVIGGLTVHYSKASADANSFIGNGKIDIDGYGFGGTLTWYGQNGFYVDGQAQATWYKSDLFSHTMDQGLANGNDSFGYVLSVEAGQRFDINQNWSLTPQAQMAYSSVDFDSFNSVFKSGSAHVSLGKADSLKTRFGISADYRNSWIGSDGKAVRSNVYGIANLYHEFLDGTDVNVSGVNFASENDRTWGGLGAGGTYSWANDKYALYGEVSLNTSLSNFADSYSIGGTSGFKIAF